MKNNENELHLIESVIEKRKKTMPDIIKDGYVFREILKGHNVRRELYDRLREEAGAFANYGNAAWKKFLLYPLHPIKGIRENETTDTLVNIMQFVLTEVLTTYVMEMHQSVKCLNDQIKQTEKYLVSYEKAIDAQPEAGEATEA